jgi:hypothetical protein
LDKFIRFLLYRGFLPHPLTPSPKGEGESRQPLTPLSFGEGLGVRLLNVLLVVLVSSFLTASTITHAQDDYAAALTITQPGVEILRVGTEQWIELPIDATTPFGVGDVLRTDNTGRAYLQVLDSELLVLPESQFELLAFDVGDGGKASFEGYAEGRTVYHIPDASLFQQYSIRSPHLTVSQAAERFALESKADAPAYVVVASGEAVIEALGESVTLGADEGLQVSDAVSPVVQIADVPINFARVESRLYGCAGVISTAGDVKLRVRAGPNDNFFYMGSIDDNTPVEMMGFAPGGGGDWYRIQFLSDFGWVLASVIESNCSDLTEYPRSGVVNPPGIVLVKDFEIPLLEPFFGQPTDDVWFYRRLNQGDGSAPQTGS